MVNSPIIFGHTQQIEVFCILFVIEILNFIHLQGRFQYNKNYEMFHIYQRERLFITSSTIHRFSFSNTFCTKYFDILINKLFSSGQLV